MRKFLLSLALTAFSPALASAGGPMTPQTAAPQALNFDAQNYKMGTTTVNSQTVRYRAYEGVVYVSNPVDKQYQSMNIYIPAEYFEGKTVGQYSARTAPIFLPNKIGGYMPGLPGTVSGQGGMGGPPPAAKGAAAPAGSAASQSSPNSIQLALSRGYVVASPGARGRTSQAADGTFTGKAPAAILDLKAAVAYLHYNDARMPGRADRIVSNGTSAGGAFSTLLGASGDNADYAAGLKEMGAAPASTAVFAVSAYCPIIDLDHADAAYEWEFGGVNDYQKLEITRDTSFQIQRKTVSGTLTAAEQAVSQQLKPQFTPYLNSLSLTQNEQALTLDAQGNGSFKTYLASLIQASAQKALDSGTDLSNIPYLTIQNGKVTAADFDAYVKAIGRMKVPPAFDGLSLENAENQLFGSNTVDARHFTAFGTQQSKVAASSADPQAVKMMNPLNYAGNGGSQTAKHWRIRVGTADKDTSHAVAAILAARLSNRGYSVDYALPWNVPHSGDYDLPELFAWMDGLMK